LLYGVNMRNKKLIIIISLVAVILRLVLCSINRDANDDHVTVVNIIADQHYLPEKADCWSCFQPKLYYYVNALIVDWFNIPDKLPRIKMMQTVNFVCSLIILFFMFKFISKYISDTELQAAVFALFSLNPALLGINSQGTNDTMTIMFGVISIFYMDKLFSNWKLSDITVVIIAIIGACLSKANGVVLFGCFILMMLIKLWANKDKELNKKIMMYFIVMLAVCGIIIFVAGNYYYNYEHFGTPFVSAFDTTTPPAFFKNTSAGRPGIQSVFEGFFSFRFGDMLNQPYITNGGENYPLHRTSFWSQLYGRSFFIHFEQWPEAWQKTDQLTIWIGRLALIFGLFPALIFVIGFLKLLKESFTNFVFLRSEKVNETHSWMHLGITLAYVIFILKFSYDVRDFACFKPIYILPGLISFIYVFMEGLKSAKKYISEKVLVSGLLILVSIHVIDLSYLAVHLHYNYHR